MLGTFSERATISQHSVVKIDEWLPLEPAALVGCGVTTGWGSAVNTGGVSARVSKAGVVQATREWIVIGGKTTTARGSRYMTPTALEAAEEDAECG